jgi:hypothetical protein
MMKTIAVASVVASASAFSSASYRSTHDSKFQVKMSDNSDMFGGEKTMEKTPAPVAAAVLSAVATPTAVPIVVEKTKQQLKYEQAAAKMRQDAADMEVAMREEARAKGLSEEMINKLIPLPRKATPKAEGAVVVEVAKKMLTASEVRAKLGYMNTGDAVRMSSELERIKQKGNINLWNAKDLGLKPNFQVSNGQLTSRTKIDPLKLKLDDVGYAYQNVFVAALVIGGVLGVSSSFIGGQLGFILGYSSALIPITLVGLGSIAPSLIGDILARFKYATDEEARDKYVHMNAGKFLVGYVLGLPVSRFDAGGPSNTMEFFQLKPSDKVGKDDKAMFKQTSFKQIDIARYFN